MRKLKWVQFLTSVALTSPTGAVDRVTELGDAQHEHDHLHRNLKGFDLELCADYDVPHVRVLDVTGVVLAQVPVTQVVSFLEGELKHVAERTAKAPAAWTLGPPRTPEELKLLADAGAANFAAIAKASSEQALAEADQREQESLQSTESLRKAVTTEEIARHEQGPTPTQPKLSRAERRAQRKASKGA